MIRPRIQTAGQALVGGGRGGFYVSQCLLSLALGGACVVEAVKISQAFVGGTVTLCNNASYQTDRSSEP